MIKRVIGLPGEKIVIDTGVILVNGRDDVDRWFVGLTSTDGEWTVAEDQIFVLSDNRSATRDDSRTFGPIDAGTARRVWWVARTGRHRGS
jgi:signal peptidase I